MCGDMKNARVLRYIEYMSLRVRGTPAVLHQCTLRSIRFTVTSVRPQYGYTVNSRATDNNLDTANKQNTSVLDTRMGACTKFTCNRHRPHMQHNHFTCRHINVLSNSAESLPVYECGTRRAQRNRY